MNWNPKKFVVAVVALVFGLLVGASAQSFQIGPSLINIVVAPGFDHATMRIPITGTAGGFSFASLSTQSDANWVAPGIDPVAKELVFAFSTASLVNSSNTATVTITDGAGTTDQVSVNAAVAPLNITKLIDDPLRSRVYGIHQNGVNGGAIVVLDPITNQNLACVTVGKKPTDLAVSADGSELLVINAVDQSLTALDLVTLRVKQVITLPTYVNWGANDTTADVAYGKGDIIYYSDGSWAPVLYVYNRATGQVLQQVTDDSNGFGDFAISPDGASLYAWAQYGWSAGWLGSYITKYSIGSDGRLTFVQRSASGYPAPPLRDPLDTPVLIDNSGQHVFVKELAVDPTALSQVYRTFPKPVYSITPGGEIAVTDSAIYEVSTALSLVTLPVTTNVQTITSDYARLVYFNKTNRTIGTIDLLQAVGSKVLNRDLSPADGAITLAPSSLQWTPLPGVDKYRVYLGVSRTAVENATTTSLEYQGEVTSPTLALSATLASGMTYYWRIDSVNSAGVTKGVVYSFTVSPISSSLAKIDTATVRGHSTHRVDVQLNAQSAMNWTASADQPWVGFVSATGSAPGTLSALFDASQLTAGIQTATITVADASTSAPLFQLPVTLQVDPLKINVMESDRSSGFVYALSEDTSTTGSTPRAYLLELDTVNKRINRVVRAGTSATDLAVHNLDGRIYVANWSVGSLLAIDKTSFQQVRAYAFAPYPSSSYSGDVYRVAAGGQGRLMVEEEDQWVDVSIFDTAAGTKVKTINLREGGGEYTGAGRYYFHGDNNSSGAEIHKYDLTGDVFTELAHTRVQSVNYYGSRTVVVTEDGERVFWNGGVFDKNLNVLWQNADEIFATSSNGHLAFSATKIYDVDAHAAIFSMPANTKVSAYNSTTQRLVVQVGTDVKFFDLGADYSLPAPVLSVSTVTSSTAALSWTDASLELSFTLQKRIAGDTAWQDVSSTIAANATTYSVSALTPATTYEFRIKADAAGQSSAWSNIATATTLDIVRPDVTTGQATAILANSASLNGSVNPHGVATSAYFEFGTTTAYGRKTATFSAGNGNVNVDVSLPATSLLANTVYHFRLVAVGNATVQGSDQTFTTLALKPAVALTSVSDITSTSILVSGSVNPNGTATSCVFEYGTTAALGQATTILDVGSGSTSTPVTMAISNLLPDTTYYIRLTASNLGGTASTAPGVFKTGPGTAVPLVAVADRAFTLKQEPVVISVLNNDSGTGALRLISVGTPSAGTALANANGTITYIPGNTFEDTDSFTYTVGDTTDATAIGTVTIANSYREATGHYHGLIGTNTSLFELSGAIDLVISRAGAIVGRLDLGGVRYPIKARLRFDEVASFTIQRGSDTTLAIAFTVDPDQETLSGAIATADGTTTFDAALVPFDNSNPAPQAGRYTLVIPPDPASSQPTGFGFAIMTISSAGSVQISGRMGSGTAFSTSSFVDAESRAAFYTTVRRPSSTSFAGWLQFDLAGGHQFDGTIGSTEKASGIATQIAMSGSGYEQPKPGSLVLPFDPGHANAAIDGWAQGTRITEPTVPVTLTPTALVAVDNRLTQLSLNRRTGSFSGFISIDGRRSRFFGVVSQSDKNGSGLIMTQSGPAALSLQSSTQSPLNSPSSEAKQP